MAAEAGTQFNSNRLTEYPFFSVVLPVFNGEKYLRQSIESVLSQDEADFELIIWDDHSNDESPLIVGSYEDPRLRYFANSKNLGLFKTLNLGIKEAKGEWIRLWSQDDVMKSNCLRSEAAFIQKYPVVGMVYCAVDTIDESGNTTLPAPWDPTPDIVDSELAAQIMFFHGSIAGNIANVLLRRDVLTDVGLFDEDMKISADFEMWVRISSTYPLGHIREPLVDLRNHSGQLSRARGSFVTSMGEDQSIYRALIARLPAEIVNYSYRYHRWRRGPMYWHHAVRCLLSKDLRNASGAYQTVKRLGINPVLMAGFWLLTANQRLYRMKPRYAGTVSSYVDH
jgi:glycosyltransferase involved in cell wall biosynthesis